MHTISEGHASVLCRVGDGVYNFCKIIFVFYKKLQEVQLSDMDAEILHRKGEGRCF